MLKREQFLPAITTTEKPDWQEKIKEIDQLKLKRAALFPTCLDISERRLMYQLLEKTSLKEAPFCHIRSDMPPRELDYLIERWGAKAFNAHSQKEFPFQYDYQKYHQMIYIENTYAPFDPEEVKDFAGLCLDFSHLENDRLLRPERYQQSIACLKKFSIGCCHLSAVQSFTHPDDNGQPIYAIHYMSQLSEFDYLKKYPLAWFSPYCAIELENPLSDQLKVIDYILKLRIKNKELI